MKKTILFFICIFFIIGISAAYAKNTDIIKPVKKEVRILKKKGKNYTVYLKYIQFKGNSPILKSINSAIYSNIKKEAEDFRSIEEDYDPNFLNYSLTTVSDPKAYLLTDNIFSYGIIFENYYCGAHGFPSYSTFNYTFKNGNLKSVDLNSLCGSHINKIKNAIVYKVNLVKNKEHENIVSKNSLRTEDMQYFSINNSGITFYFGGYAFEGTCYEFNRILLPWNEITDYIDNNIIKEYGKKHSSTKYISL